jgi:hypothetical protein
MPEIAEKISKIHPKRVHKQQDKKKISFSYNMWLALP